MPRNQSHPLTRLALISLLALGFLNQAGASASPIVSIVAASPRTSEPLANQMATPGIFTLKRTGGLDAALDAMFTFGGTAEMGYDYEAIPSEVHFNAGETEAHVAITPKHDLLVEGDETVVVELASSEHYAVDQNNRRAVITIADTTTTNDLPVVSIQATQPVTTEPTTTSKVQAGIFTISRTDASSAFNVFLSFSGSATAPDDYMSPPTYLHFDNGEFAKRIEIAPKSDTLVEGDETVLARVVMPPTMAPQATAYRIDPAHASATVTIKDEDTTSAPASLTIIAPHDGDTMHQPTNILIRVVAVDPYSYIPRVEFYSGGKLIGVSDLAFIQMPAPGTPIQHSFTWTNPPPGIQTLTARATRDNGEQVTSAPITINVIGNTNAATLVYLNTTDASAKEPGPLGIIDGAVFVFTRVGGDTNSPLSVAFSLTGTAQAGIDYIDVDRSVTFQSGQSQARVTIYPKTDDVTEPDETVIMQIVPPPCAAIFPPPPGCYQIGGSGMAQAIIHDTPNNPTNQPPVAHLVSPTAGATFIVGDPISILAEASDPDGTIAKLFLYDNGHGIGGSGGTNRYGFTWYDATVGTHTLYAMAIDNVGASNKSAEVTITVKDRTTNQPPIVTLDSPAPGSSYWNTEGIPVGAQAIDPDGTIAHLAVFMDGNELGAAEHTNRLALTWWGGSLGQHTLYAMAVDNSGATNRSPEVKVTILTQGTNKPPIARMVSPIPGATYGLDQPIPIVAEASDPDGMISKLIVYDNGKLLRSAATNRVAFTWTNAPFGLHSLSAVAIDNLGATNRSLEAKITIHGDTTNKPPIARITNPQAGSVFTVGDAIPVVAEGTDLDGAIAKLVVLAEDEQIGVAFETNRFTFNWTGATIGSHYITAIATDFSGATNRALGVQILVRSREASAFVFRDLPDSYTPGVTFTVTLKTEPSAGSAAYAIEDHPPTGWRISNIEGGLYDTNTAKVKFGPYFDSTNRIFIYHVTPPTNATGVYEFTGTGSLDGVGYSIAGDHIIERAPTVHPADTNADYRLVINELTEYAAAWKRGQDIPMSYLTRAGYLWTHGETYHFDGGKLAPLCWVLDADRIAKALSESTLDAERLGSMSTEPGSASTVTLNVAPPAGTSAYAVEEKVADGWTVSNISNDGTFNSSSSSIRWGVFFDATARTLSYELTPPINVTSVARLSGKVSYDGIVAELTGSDRLTSSTTAQSPKLTDCERDADGKVRLTLNGGAGQVGVLQGSTDLIHWQDVTTLFLPDGSVQFTDDAGASADLRYYRLQVR